MKTPSTPSRVSLRMYSVAAFMAAFLATELFTTNDCRAARTPETKPEVRTKLPEEHPYQRTLRAFMATLKEEDFAPGVTASLTLPPSSEDPEYQYRNYLYGTMLQPLVGTKRGAPSVKAPAKLFLLSAIENPEGVRNPPVWPESLMSFVQWEYPGNLYYGNPALKLRAFVSGSVKLMMIDDYLDQVPSARRSDWLGYQLVYAGAPYLGFKDLLPPGVQKAYEDGLLRLGRRLMEFGPRGEEPNLDLTTPVGLWYASKAGHDPKFSEEAEAYARKLFTDPRYFHPAGYFLERGGLDVGYAGMNHYFAVWLALASDWPFARDAVERCYRLRAHLILPEPEGKITGPSHFNSRIGSPASADQWDWAFRDYGAAMLTDEAVCLAKLPSAEMLSVAPANRAKMFNFALSETAGIKTKTPTEEDFGKLTMNPWAWRLWDTYNFPGSVNFAYEFYRPGAYSHRMKLEAENSPFLKSPFLRAGTFVRNFENAFVVSKQPAYSVILHTGPVGTQDPSDGLFQFAAPLGFGGGQLSAFWTPSTGSIVLGRRAGMHWETIHDKVEEWRLWPIHAVSGCTREGKAFTSARIAKPDVSATLEKDRGTVTVSGVLPAEQLEQGKVLNGAITYRRTFQIHPEKLVVETKVVTDGKDAISELYETLPVLLLDRAISPKAAPTVIEFRINDKWVPATEEYQEQVTAVKLSRYDGAVQMKLDRPRRVKLSPSEWKDTYLSKAVCRNVMIDLLPGNEKTVSYELSPASIP